MNEFLHEFAHLMTDPAHVAVEFTFVAMDYLIIHTVARGLKKHFHRDMGINNDH